MTHEELWEWIEGPLVSAVYTDNTIYKSIHHNNVMQYNSNWVVFNLDRLG